MKQHIEEEFRKVSSYEIQSAKRRYNEAKQNLYEALPENNVESEFTPQEHLNAAGEHFAFAIEHGLKSNIIFDDFRQSVLFNQPNVTQLQFGNKIINVPAVGSDEWHSALAGNNRDLNFISDPKEIRTKIILLNNPRDERSNIKTEPQFNPDYLTLSKDGSRPTGHTLYGYYQLQSAVAKNLINTEYYCYVENEFKYTIYALLTEDVLHRDNNEKTIMPRDLMEKLDALKNSAIDLRYASISFDDIKEDELKFLKEFSSSVITIGEYRYPLPKKYSEFDFEQFNHSNLLSINFPLFEQMDKMSKYYIQSCFDNNEIISFINYIELLKKSGTNLSDLYVYINTVTYLKNYVKNIMKINLTFTEVQFARIDNFCRLIKAFKPFDSDSKRLCDNEAFSTQEKIDVYISKIKIEQEKYSAIGKRENEFSSGHWIMRQHKKNWEEIYEIAKNYYKHYGNLEVPLNFKTVNGYDYDENGVSLGYWIMRQRQAFKENKLSEERIFLLNQIEMIWNQRPKNWKEFYEIAKNYYEHYGNLEVPLNFKTVNGYDYDENGVSLGYWIMRQCQAFKENKLSEEQISLLNKILINNNEILNNSKSK